MVVGGDDLVFSSISWCCLVDNQCSMSVLLRHVIVWRISNVSSIARPSELWFGVCDELDVETEREAFDDICVVHFLDEERFAWAWLDLDDWSGLDFTQLVGDDRSVHSSVFRTDRVDAKIELK